MDDEYVIQECWKCKKKFKSLSKSFITTSDYYCEDCGRGIKPESHRRNRID